MDHCLTESKSYFSHVLIDNYYNNSRLVLHKKTKTKSNVSPPQNLRDEIPKKGNNSFKIVWSVMVCESSYGDKQTLQSFEEFPFKMLEELHVPTFVIDRRLERQYENDMPPPHSRSGRHSSSIWYNDEGGGYKHRNSILFEQVFSLLCRRGHTQ